jgi:hypothetical protein
MLKNKTHLNFSLNYSSHLLFSLSSHSCFLCTTLCSPREIKVTDRKREEEEEEEERRKKKKKKSVLGHARVV